MAIRWVSNPQSIKANQPSVLGIVETLAAMGVSVWIAVTWDTYLHIAVGASIAPLLLMRTDESCIRGAAFAEMLAKPVELLDELTVPRVIGWIASPFVVVLALLWIPIAMLLGRVGAWVMNLVQHPLLALAAIPSNWGYAAVVIDSKKWPDLLPKPRKMPASSGPEYEHVGDVIRALRAPDSFEDTMEWMLLVAATPPLILPAFVYRWSLKSTAIIWFPLLWALRSVREAGKPLRTYLDIYLRDPITTIVLWVSVVSIIGLVGKIVVFNVQVDLVDSWNTVPLLSFFSLYITPQEIQWWQVAMVINSAIAIAMYILAHRWLVRIEHKVLTDEALPRKLFQVGLFVRPILSLYTILCTLYITIRAASDWNLPALGTRPFPWL